MGLEQADVEDTKSLSEMKDHLALNDNYTTRPILNLGEAKYITDIVD